MKEKENETTMKLKDILPCIAYGATIHLVETERGKKEYDYIFKSTDFIQREDIEKSYPELLEREISDGIHGEGPRSGLYIHLYKEKSQQITVEKE